MPVSQNGLPGIYNLVPESLEDGAGSALAVDENQRLKLSNTDPGAFELYSALQGLVAGTEVHSILKYPGRREDAFQVTINSADASSSTVVKAKTTAKNIYVTDLIISVGGAMSVKIQDDAASPEVLVQSIYMAANTSVPVRFDTPLRVATNQDLRVLASTSGNISVTALGYVI